MVPRSKNAENFCSGHNWRIFTAMRAAVTVKFGSISGKRLKMKNIPTVMVLMVSKLKVKNFHHRSFTSIQGRHSELHRETEGYSALLRLNCTPT